MSSIKGYLSWKTSFTNPKQKSLLGNSGDNKAFLLTQLRENTLDPINKNGETPLTEACKKSEEAALKVFSNMNKYNLHQTNKTNYTALMIACERKMEQLALKILDNPNDCALNQVNKNGNNSLMIACYYQMENVCMKMINTPYLCELNTINKQGYTIFMIACYYKMENVCAKILSTSNLCPLHITDKRFGHSALTILCTNNTLESIILKMLEARHLCALGHITNHGNTALTAACSNKMYNVCFLFL